MELWKDVVGADGCTIKVDFTNGKGSQLVRYNPEKSSKIAMEILVTNFGKTEIYFMPEDNAINAKLNISEQKIIISTGKRQKGMVVHETKKSKEYKERI